MIHRKSTTPISHTKFLPLFLFITLLTILLLSTCSSNSQPRSQPDDPAACLDSVMIVGHRGSAGIAPENTIEAFERGIALGVDAVELDVHLTKDGRIVVIHDSTIDRTSTGVGPVNGYTLDQLQTFDVSTKFFEGRYGPQSIPTLEEVLKLIDGRVAVQLEIKVDAKGDRYPGIEELVLHAVTDAGLKESIWILSFDFPTIKHIEELDPTINSLALIGKTYMTAISAKGPDEVVRQILETDTDGVGISYAYLSPVLYERLRNAGLAVGVWTVDTVALAMQYCNMGVDFITTNRPDLFRPH